MPTYEYKCDACGLEFERFQQMSAAPVKKCPRCGKAKVRKLISAGAGMIFKGSGFYITDYRDQGYKDKAKADTAPAAGAETKGESKGEAAGDAKGDSKSEVKADSKAETKPESKGSGAESSPKPAESTPTVAAAKPEPKASRSAKKK